MTDRPCIAIDARKLGDTGVGRHVQTLLTGLARTPQAAGMEWHAYGPVDRWHYVVEAPEGMRRLTFRSGPYSPWQHLEGYVRLRRHPADIFHATHFTTPLVLPRRTRLVVTIHDAHLLDRPDLVSDGNQSRARLLAYRLLMHLAVHRADVVSTVSHAGADDLRRLLPAVAGKLRVVSNSLDLTRFRPGAMPKGVAPDVILFTGSLTRRKGVDVLVEAYASDADLRSAYRLALVGPTAPADAAPIVRRIDALGLRDRVLVPGPTSNDDELRAWYARARVVVLPSFLESFGYPVLEAMALGIPCIATDLPAVREASGGAALLVVPGDIPGLAVAMRRATRDKSLRASLAERGLERARTYGAEAMGEQTLATYRDVLGR